MQIITRDEIERSGKASVSDLLRSLAVNAGGLSGAEVGGFTPGAATLSLRGLGGQATLVLINGRRIAPYGVTGFQSVLTNLDSMPLQAIDRIEVLKDGASAIYGSDAIAGVVNIILRRDYNGFEARATYARSEDGPLPIWTTSLTGGFGDIGGDRYNVFFTYEHRDQEQVLIKDAPRGLRARLVDDADWPGRRDRRFIQSFPGNIFVTTPGGTVGPLPGCPPEQIGFGGFCRDDSWQVTTAYPDLKRDLVFARGTFELTPRVSLFSELGYSTSEYKYQYSAQQLFNSPADQLLIVPGARVGSPAAFVGVYTTAGDLGPRQTLADVDESRFLVGAKGSLGSWDFDAAVGIVESKVGLRFKNLILEDRFFTALNNGSYLPGRVNSPAVLASLSPDGAFHREGKATFQMVDLKASTELFQLPSGPLGFAAGAEFRKEKSSDRYAEDFIVNRPVDVDGDNIDDGVTDGNVFGFGGLPAVRDYKRDVTSAFVEFNVPILRTLEASLAARFDDYSVGGNSTVPKIGLKWNAAPALVLRGTYAEGFRAPNVRELADSPSVGFTTIRDPVRCPPGAPDTNPDCALPIQITANGNPGLKPEKAESYTLGFIVEPVKDVSFSVDWFDIKRKEEINSLDLTFLLANQGIYASFIDRAASGSITNIRLPYVNIGETQVRGVDVDGRVKNSFGELGSLTVRAVATYYQNYFITPVPGAERADYIGTWNQPRFRGNLLGTWERGPWTTEVGVNYIHRFEYNATPFDAPCNVRAIWGASNNYCSVFSWTTVDTFVRYRGIRNLTLSLGIANLFDRKPPLDIRSGFDSGDTPWNQTYHNPLGRFYTVAVGYKFK